MAEMFLFEVVTPERKLVSEDVNAVYAPGDQGEFGVLPQHAPLLALLKIGELRYYKDGEEKHMAISGGFAEVDQTHMRVLAETAEFSEEIDVERAEQAKSRAVEKLKELDVVEHGDEFVRMEAALLRAINRLQVAGKK